MRILGTILLTVVTGVLLTTPAGSGRTGRCDPAVSGELDRLQVDPAGIAGISYQVRTHENSRGDTYVDRILAWVDLRSCVGKLVIELSPRCRVKQAFTTHACAVPGVAAY